jgi:nitrate reductase NapE component
MYEPRAEPGPSWWEEDNYRLCIRFWAVKNMSELADCSDHYVKLQGQGTYFVTSANWLMLPLCTWLPPSLPLEKCADQKLANVLYSPLSNPPNHGRARVLLLFLFLIYALFSVLACSFVVCLWVICIDLWEFRVKYILWSNSVDGHWYYSLCNHTHETHHIE